MKIVFFGTPHFVIPVLEALLKHYEVVAVVTAPDHFDSRKHQLVPSPIKYFYQHYYETHTNINQPHPLQIFTPVKLDKEFIDRLMLLKPDISVVAAYGKIIPKEVLSLAAIGNLNIHPSLLPKYRGPSPIPTALLSGDTATGVTLIKMDEQLDHGPILTKESVDIMENDTFETLAKRLFEKSASVLPMVIKEYIAGSIKPIPQDETKVTFTKRITKDNGFIDPTHPPTKEQFERMVRAYYPWPGVWTNVSIKNQEVRIKFLPENNIQMQGKKAIPLKDFLNGYPELKENMTKLFE